MKAKTVKGNWSWRTKKFALPSVFLICIFFFLAGFFGSSLFSHSKEDLYGVRPRPRLLESTTAEADNYLLPAGESSDDSITSIPFQVLSWKPRALYFPKFASAEQCESIIDIAKAGLKPSTLALRKGETEKNTKGIRTRYRVCRCRIGPYNFAINWTERAINCRLATLKDSRDSQLIPKFMMILIGIIVKCFIYFTISKSKVLRLIFLIFTLLHFASNLNYGVFDQDTSASCYELPEF